MPISRKALPKNYPGPGPLGQTDPDRWRLESWDHGKHNWRYISEEENEEEIKQGKGQNNETKYWMGLKMGTEALPDPDGDPLAAARNGFEFYKKIQSPDGHWAGEYGGPMFILPGLIISMYVTGTPIPEEWKIEISRYLANMQRRNGPDDQGWGIHIEAHSSVFGTALNYVVLRILGVGPDQHPMMVRARSTLHKLGGATGIPSWGKFWLSVLGVYEWDGMNPVHPELWLLPEWLPFHPWRWWVHTRAVYVPMGYLWGKRFKPAETALIKSLRQELYVQPYESINWPSCRNKICAKDLYSPHPLVLDTLFSILSMYEKVHPGFVRKAGLDRAYKLIVMEDENTNCQDIAPVSKAMHLVCRWDREGSSSPAVQLHIKNIKDYLWLGKEGLMGTGTNGSQLWDLAFISQALVETGLAEEQQNKESVLKALEWLDDCQIRDNPKFYKEAYRHTSKGAWPFSTREQGYTVSDTTAEALKAVMYLQDLSYTPELVSKERMCDAVDVLLSMQNKNNGFASYELIRGSHLLELLNPAEVFGNIMTEYSYPECTTAVLTTLTIFHKHYPDYRADDIKRVTSRAIQFIHSSQRPDGSWFGSWAICFTYATMFALESLALNGETYSTSERAKTASHFLLDRQMPDGGWGESYKACETGKYVHHVKSQVVNTAWAILGLISAECPDLDAIRRGTQLIMARQKPDGRWEQEAIEGVFNKNCAISYPNFKFSWTIWALGKASKYLAEVEGKGR